MQFFFKYEKKHLNFNSDKNLYDDLSEMEMFDCRPSGLIY